MSVRAEFDTVVIDSAGNALADIEVTVNVAGTATAATIYSGKTGGGTIANPLSTGSDGLVQFWANPGSYDLSYHDTQLPTRISDREFTWESISGEDDGIPQDKIDGLATTLADIQDVVIPTGAVLPYAGPSAPTGFFICDGAAKSKTTYADLFAVIGSTFGESGSNFYIPDLRGRVPVGVPGSSGRLPFASAFGIDGLASVGGEETHILSISEMPAHQHTTQVLGGVIDGVTGGVGSGTPPWTISAFTSNPFYGSDWKGGGQPHYNMPPYQILNYIIKY